MVLLRVKYITYKAAFTSYEIAFGRPAVRVSANTTASRVGPQEASRKLSLT